MAAWENSALRVSIMGGDGQRAVDEDRRDGLPGGAGDDDPARRYLSYERAGWAFSGSQMLMWRVSGMMNRQMMKHTAGTTMG
jgi:hypothetical protein